MEPFDADTVRAAWDFAAEGYAHRQASGHDYYRDALFGPAQIALCGDVAGARLLDVGCGAGYFSRAMAARGAHVTAVDISARMIEQARRLGGAIDYAVVDAAELATRFPAGSFDVVTACMSLLDMPEPARALAQIQRVLRPGGRCIASISHPCMDTPFRRWQRDEHRRKQWLCIDRYFERGPKPFTWDRAPYEFTTSSLHTPLEDWFAWIRASGLAVRDLREPRPTAEDIARVPDLADAARVPYFLLFELVA